MKVETVEIVLDGETLTALVCPKCRQRELWTTCWAGHRMRFVCRFCKHEPELSLTAGVLQWVGE